MTTYFRHLLLIAAGLLLAGRVAAQPAAIQARSVMPLGASYELTYNDFLNGFTLFSPGAAGPNQVYDFRNDLQQGIAFTDTTDIIAPATNHHGAPPFAASVSRQRRQPGSDVDHLQHTLDGLFRVGSSSVSLTGNVVRHYRYQRPERLLQATNAYRSQSTDTTVFNVRFDVPDNFIQAYVVDSVYRRMTTVVTSVFDGWGTVRTPFGDFPCLRQKRQIITYDSADFKNKTTGQWLRNESIQRLESQEFLYWSPNYGVPLLELRDPNNSGVFDFAVWLSGVPGVPMAVTADADAASVAVWPNPARDAVNVQLPTPPGAPVRVTLHNAAGQEVQRLATCDAAVRLSCTHLPPGLYMLRVWSEAFQAVRRVVVE